MNEHIENARNVVNGWAAVLAANAPTLRAIADRMQQAAVELRDVRDALGAEFQLPAAFQADETPPATETPESPRGESVDEQVQRLIHEARARLDRAEALLVQRRIQPVEYKELPTP